jgi:hypothetical protein
MKNLQICLVLLCVVLAGCSSPGSDVHVQGILMSGYVQTSISDPNITLPCYWKDGVLNLLSTGSKTNGGAFGVNVIGKDVYYFGWTVDGSTSTWPPVTQTPVYWKNGVIQTLTIPAGAFGNAKWGFIDVSGDFLVAGGISDASGNGIPGYWKNGAWTPVSMTLASGTALRGDASWSLSWDSSGNIYNGGWLEDPMTSLQVPVYWKNGTTNEISLASVGGSKGGLVESYILPPAASSLTILLTVNDNSGIAVPAYMVNGSITKLPVTNGFAWGGSLSPSGDFYVTGMLGANWSTPQPVYWKNWSINTLPMPAGYPYGIAGGASFAGNDVYIDGTVQNASGFSSAVFWKNGALNVQTNGDYVGAGEHGYLLE